MSKGFVAAGLALLVGLLWLLAPPRSGGLRPPPGVRAGDVVEITYMGPTGPLQPALSDAALEFERLSVEAHRKNPAHPVYRIVAGQTGVKDMTGDPTRFMLSIAGGMPPDVINFDRFAIAEWAARGAFTPLDDYIAADLKAGHPNAIRSERYYKSVWEEASYQNRVYGIPTDVDDRILYYNKDLFRRAGLVDAAGEPVPPRTWSELRAAAKKLNQFDETGRLRVLGISPTLGSSGGFYMFAFLNGARFMSPDGLICTLNEPRAVQTLQYLVDLYGDAGGYQQVMAYQAGFQGGALDPFLIGKVAMRIEGQYYIPLILQFARDMDYGVAPPPLSDQLAAGGAKPTSLAGGWSYAIPANARHKAAAWEFIRFLASDRVQEMLAEGNRDAIESQGRIYVPGFVSRADLNERFLDRYVFSNPRMPAAAKVGMRIAADLLPESRPRPITPVGQVLWARHVTAMEEACYLKKSPQQALDDAAALVQRELDRFLHPPQGRPVHWTWFYVAYGLLVVLFAAGAWQWDTHTGFRRRVAERLRLKRAVREAGLDLARGSFARQQWRAGYAMVAPWVVGFIIFGGGPLLFSILMSFCDYDMFNPPRWIGLANFRYFFGQDALVPKAIVNTLFMVIGVPLGMTASLSLAMLLNQPVRVVSVWRTLFYLPAIMPAVASMVLWIWIFNPMGGVINKLIEVAGVQGPNWLASEQWSKPALILMGLWGAGAQMLIWLAGLKGISPHYYEAAALDGAGRWKQFRHVTLPMLTPYIFFNLVMGFIGIFQIFEVAFIMTQGGPVNSTLFYVYHLFNNAFRYGHMGYASAMAWVLFAIIMALTFVQLKLANRWVYYEGD
ncbi:MAG: extracellular solute-binding protein [bacterium]|nr:extracellular solute-binding protein [bacterium]